MRVVELVEPEALRVEDVVAVQLDRDVGRELMGGPLPNATGNASGGTQDEAAGGAEGQYIAAAVVLDDELVAAAEEVFAPNAMSAPAIGGWGDAARLGCKFQISDLVLHGPTDDSLERRERLALSGAESHAVNCGQSDWKGNPDSPPSPDKARMTSIPVSGSPSPKRMRVPHFMRGREIMAAIKCGGRALIW